MGFPLCNKLGNSYRLIKSTVYRSSTTNAFQSWPIDPQVYNGVVLVGPITGYMSTPFGAMKIDTKQNYTSSVINGLTVQDVANVSMRSFFTVMNANIEDPTQPYRNMGYPTMTMSKFPTAVVVANTTGTPNTNRVNVTMNVTEYELDNTFVENAGTTTTVNMTCEIPLNLKGLLTTSTINRFIPVFSRKSGYVCLGVLCSDTETYDASTSMMNGNVIGVFKASDDSGFFIKRFNAVNVNITRTSQLSQLIGDDDFGLGDEVLGGTSVAFDFVNETITKKTNTVFNPEINSSNFDASALTRVNNSSSLKFDVINRTIYDEVSQKIVRLPVDTVVFDAPVTTTVNRSCVTIDPVDYSMYYVAVLYDSTNGKSFINVQKFAPVFATSVPSFAGLNSFTFRKKLQPTYWTPYSSRKIRSMVFNNALIGVDFGRDALVNNLKFPTQATTTSNVPVLTTQSSQFKLMSLQLLQLHKFVILNNEIYGLSDYSTTAPFFKADTKSFTSLIMNDSGYGPELGYTKFNDNLTPSEIVKILNPAITPCTDIPADLLSHLIAFDCNYSYCYTKFKISESEYVGGFCIISYTVNSVLKAWAAFSVVNVVTKGIKVIVKECVDIPSTDFINKLTFTENTRQRFTLSSLWGLEYDMMNADADAQFGAKAIRLHFDTDATSNGGKVWFNTKHKMVVGNTVTSDYFTPVGGANDLLYNHTTNEIVQINNSTGQIVRKQQLQSQPLSNVMHCQYDPLTSQLFFFDIYDAPAKSMNINGTECSGFMVASVEWYADKVEGLYVNDNGTTKRANELYYNVGSDIPVKVRELYYNDNGTVKRLF